VDQELDEELRYHVEPKTQRYAANGLEPIEARRRAMLDMDGIERSKEECRDMRKVNWLHDLTQDIRYSLRMLRNSPGFTVMAVLTLALGIGANTAIFSVASALLLRPLPVPEPSRVFALARGDGGAPPASHPDFVDYRSRAGDFLELAAYLPTPLSFGRGTASDVILGEIVSANYFSALGIAPAQGRTFLPEEDQPGAHSVVVVSHECWQNRLQGDSTPVGKTLVLNGRNFTVVGVAPPGFYGASVPLRAEVWLPVSMQAQAMPSSPDLLADRRQEWLAVLGRLKPGVPPEQAQSVLNTIDRQLQTEHAELYSQASRPELRHLSLLKLQGIYLPHIRRMATMASVLLLAVVGMVLLIACANVAGLLLARTATRRREIATRVALGAGRGRIIRQMLTEGMLLAACGMLAGLLFAFFANGLLMAFRPPIPAPWTFSTEIRLDLPVLVFATCLAAATVLLCASAPALQACKVNLLPALKNEGEAGPRRLRLRKLLVTAQVALSLVLLVCAGLFVRSLRSAQTMHVGFETRNGIVMSFDLGLQGYSEARARAFYSDLEARLHSLPGVSSMALANFIPLGSMNTTSPLQIEGRETSPDRLAASVGSMIVDKDYFQTMGVPIVNGRAFAAQDIENSLPVVIVSEAMVRRFWPEEDPIGKRVRVGGPDSPLCEIVGVAADTKHTSLGPPPPVAYLPFSQRYFPRMNLVVRTASNPQAGLAAIRQEVAALDPNAPVQGLRTMENHVDFAFWPTRMGASLLGIFGLLGLSLATVGVFGVVSYSVAQRTHEMGIRMALGAQSRDVMKMILVEGMSLALVGAGLGLGGALIVTRLLGSLLYGVSPTDGITFAGVVALLAVVALAACYIPARRAARVHPMVALRYE
jgi:putative ABC transport system permease protein